MRVTVHTYLVRDRGKRGMHTVCKVCISAIDSIYKRVSVCWCCYWCCILCVKEASTLHFSFLYLRDNKVRLPKKRLQPSKHAGVWVEISGLCSAVSSRMLSVDHSELTALVLGCRFEWSNDKIRLFTTQHRPDITTHQHTYLVVSFCCATVTAPSFHIMPFPVG